MSLKGLEGGSNLIAGYTIQDIDETGGTYFYYGFQKADGGWLILRTDTASTSYRLCVGSGAYTTAWTNKSTQSYGYIA